MRTEEAKTTDASPHVDRAEVRRLLAAYVTGGRPEAALRDFEALAADHGAGAFIAVVVARWDGRRPEFRAFAEDVARRIELAAGRDPARRH